MICYQNPDFQYPDMTRFICYASAEEAEAVIIWLNDSIPGGFIVHEAADHFTAVPYYWLSVYIKEKSHAALFKMSWKTTETFAS